MNGSWRTTLAGIATAVASVATAIVVFLKTGTLDAATISALGTAIVGVFSALGLNAARDKGVTSEQQGIK